MQIATIESSWDTLADEKSDTQDSDALPVIVIHAIHDALKTAALQAERDIAATPWWRLFAKGEAIARAMAMTDAWGTVVQKMKTLSADQEYDRDKVE